MQEESAPAAHERNFAAQLRLVRESRGMSQAELARAATECGAPMQQQTVAKIERGGQTISLDQAGSLATALGRPLAELLGPPEDSLTAEQTERALSQVSHDVEALRAQLTTAEQQEGTARRQVLDLRSRLAELQARERLLTERLVELGGGRYETGDLSIDPADVEVELDAGTGTVTDIRLSPEALDQAKAAGATEEQVKAAIREDFEQRYRASEDG